MFPFSKKRNFFLSSVKVGDVYATKIEEIIAGNEAILNLKGNLIKVKNHSNLPSGQYVSVRVTQTEPNLIFEIIPNNIKMDFRKSSFEIQG